MVYKSVLLYKDTNSVLFLFYYSTLKVIHFVMFYAAIVCSCKMYSKGAALIVNFSSSVVFG